MKYFRLLVVLLALHFPIQQVKAETGYRLWLRYDLVSNANLLTQYRDNCKALWFDQSSATAKAAKSELTQGLNGLLGTQLGVATSVTTDGTIVIGTPASSSAIAALNLDKKLKTLGGEGFLIMTTKINNKKCIVITANEDIGLLYGTFHFLKLMQTQQDIQKLSIASSPKLKVRMLNHWDNLNGTIERGYAGRSIWDWKSLPAKIDQRYVDYARANASIGINGAVLNNVNADPRILTKEYLIKIQALATTFRPYGIKVYLTPVFSAPIEVGGLKTADPLDPTVIAWWKEKVDEIYKYIPDFGGFCVKANSEGQPGPQDYKRSHVDGANMMADALSPHGGIVMWRAFVYDTKGAHDRTKQAYEEFKPLDGKFNKNVFLQVKNGPIDFQPREPYHPLFGAMPKTPLMMEFQITQEYLGFSTHLVYLGSLYKETLESNTYANGKSKTVSKVIQQIPHQDGLNGMAGVANIGNDENWSGHPFAQANWYVYGRLAWDPDLSAESIANEWLKMTFTNDPDFLNPVKDIMTNSREVAVDYMNPLGLTMLMDESHYRPAPWRKDKIRADGTTESFHKADAQGIGFNRTKSGSNAVAQYFPKVERQLANLEDCPEELLLWFHHVDWNHKMKSGRNLWNELCHRYYGGVDSVRKMNATWLKMKGLIDEDRFQQVKELMAEQEEEAIIWRDACVLYFQTFSKMPIPDKLEKPARSLEYYRSLKYTYPPKK